jgi:hypothetical protein
MNAPTFPFDDADFSSDDASTVTAEPVIDGSGAITVELEMPEEPSRKARASRAFSVSTKKTKVKYTFKYFSSARMGANMFSTTGGTLEERSTLFDEIAYSLVELEEQLKELDKKGITANGGTTVALVPIDMLTIDERWCREKRVDWNHVAEIVMNFRPGSLSLPTVTFRKIFDAEHRLVEVIISLTDGVHRTVSLMELGHTHVRAICMVVNDVKDEAQLYSDLNYNTRSHGRLDIQRGRMAAEDPELKRVVEFISKFGFKFPTSGKKAKWPELFGIQTVVRILSRYGEETTGRMFELITNPANAEWVGQEESITADMMAGVVNFIDRFEKPGYIHSNMTDYLFKNVGPKVVQNIATSLNPQACDEILHRASTSKGAGSESTRQKQYTAALVSKVRDLFKPANRPTEGFLPKFRDAFMLYYSANEDKARTLTDLRKGFAKKKVADYWFAKSHSELTR